MPLDFSKYKRTVFNDLNKRFRNTKMHMLNFLFRLATLKILHKKEIFSVKSKKKKINM